MAAERLTDPYRYWQTTPSSARPENGGPWPDHRLKTLSDWPMTRPLRRDLNATALGRTDSDLAGANARVARDPGGVSRDGPWKELPTRDVAQPGARCVRRGTPGPDRASATVVSNRGTAINVIFIGPARRAAAGHRAGERVEGEKGECGASHQSPRGAHLVEGVRSISHQGRRDA